MEVDSLISFRTRFTRELEEAFLIFWNLKFCYSLGDGDLVLQRFLAQEREQPGLERVQQPRVAGGDQGRGSQETVT